MKRLLLGTVFSALASAAVAADIPVPVYKAPPATVVSASGWYLSVDGAWRRVNLPDYALGFRQVTFPFSDLGLMQSFKQRLDGFRVRGAVGYFLPPEISQSIWGANTRVEIGGFYGRASGSQTGTAVSPGGASGFRAATLLTLDGVGGGDSYVCAPNQVCTVSSNLSTTYSDWQLHGKVAGDYRVGAVSLTPSVALFGGNARNNQTLTQTLTLSPVPDRDATYHASTSLRWTDVGARAGLDLKADVTPQVAVGLSGWAGFAGRHVSLSGADVTVDNFPGGALNGGSIVSVSANTTPVLANAEAGIAFKWLPALIVRGFVGLDYDSKVPGLVSPGLIGVGATTAASISFHSRTSYYAGGGVTWTFGPAP